MKCKFEKCIKEFEKESKSIYNIIQKHQLYTKNLTHRKKGLADKPKNNCKTVCRAIY